MKITLFEIGQPVTIIINRTGSIDHNKWKFFTCSVTAISKKHIYVNSPFEVVNIKKPSIIQYLIEKLTKSGYPVYCNITGQIIGRAYFGE